MALDHKITTANAVLDALAALFPAGAILEIRTGASPGAENAATGTLLASITLPATPWNAAASGAVTKNGTWQTASADGTGTAAHFRLKDSVDTHRIDGTVGQGSGDLSLDNTSIATTQVVTISTFQLTLA
jgi:hypothetical protein